MVKKSSRKRNHTPVDRITGDAQWMPVLYFPIARASFRPRLVLSRPLSRQQRHSIVSILYTSRRGLCLRGSVNRARPPVVLFLFEVAKFPPTIEKNRNLSIYPPSAPPSVRTGSKSNFLFLFYYTFFF